MMVPGRNGVLEALAAGLLDPFFARAGWVKVFPRVLELFEFTLMILTPALVYLSVIQEVDKALDETEIDVSLESCNGLEISDKWKVFWRALEHPGEVMDDYLEGQAAALRACDDIQCGAIYPKRRFRRCSGCLTSVYCSPACQVHDWQAGHRGWCKSFRALRAEELSGISTKDRSFLRALFHHDYLQGKYQILAGQLECLRLQPDGTPFVMLDYTDNSSTAVKVTLNFGESLDELIS
ncbi:hypothetical protein C8R43DRAFT_1024128 [Mycena crocata]|nr:hypothetical protein C8R43DRAFT_1024128 [Mycena crocata]